MYWVGCYIGMAILTSMTMPPNLNLHGEYIDEVPAHVRVLVGLLWPLYYLLKYINRR